MRFNSYGPGNAHKIEFDCLRGIGIIAVVWFHAGLAGVSGALLYVDMFFVMSGFLVTHSIYRFMFDLEAQEIKMNGLLKYVERRARRILPAVLILILIVQITAYFFVLPLDLVELASSSIRSALFVGNHYFAGQGNYFQTDPSSMPLLHTWSLSVEEQFYMLVPFLVWALSRFSLRAAVFSALIICSVSIAYATFGSFGGFGDTYYLLSTRAWEFIFGVVAAIVTIRRPELSDNRYSKYIGQLGFYIFIICGFVFTKHTPHPSIFSVIPIAGISLYIYARPNIWLFDKILSNHILAFLGQMSYSIYLVHYPVTSFFQSAGLLSIPSMKVVLIFICLFVGAAYFYGIEANRRIRTLSTRGFTLLIMGLMLAITSISMIYKSSNGLPNRLSLEAQEFYVGKFNVNTQRGKCLNTKNVIPHGYGCRYNEEFEYRTALIGDSHSDAIAEPLFELLGRKEQGLLHLWYAECPPIGKQIISFDVFSEECVAFNLGLEKRIFNDTNIQKIYIAARWQWYLLGSGFDNQIGGKETKEPYWLKAVEKQNDYETYEQLSNKLEKSFADFVSKLKQKNLEVIIFEPVPEAGWDVPNVGTRNIFLHNMPPNTDTSYLIYQSRNRQVVNFLRELGDQGSVTVYPSESVFCNKFNILICTTSLHGRSLYYDSHHLNNGGAELLLDHFNIR